MTTVTNIVFDMGGVLMGWDPVRISLALCDDFDDAALVAHAVFDSREWGWADAGAVSLETVAWTAKLKVPSRLHAVVDRFVDHWHDAGIFDPIPGMDALIRDLKARGFGIYLLSNAATSFALYRDRIPAIELFDGVLVSCYEHVVKPDAPIYWLLCERYGLDAASCLFVDDLERNVIGAQRAGMQGYVFDGNVGALHSFICEQL